MNKKLFEQILRESSDEKWEDYENFENKTNSQMEYLGKRSNNYDKTVEVGCVKLEYSSDSLKVHSFHRTVLKVYILDELVYDSSNDNRLAYDEFSIRGELLNNLSLDSLLRSISKEPINYGHNPKMTTKPLRDLYNLIYKNGLDEETVDEDLKEAGEKLNKELSKVEKWGQYANVAKRRRDYNLDSKYKDYVNEYEKENEKDFQVGDWVHILNDNLDMINIKIVKETPKKFKVETEYGEELLLDKEDVLKNGKFGKVKTQNKSPYRQLNVF